MNKLVLFGTLLASIMIVSTVAPAFAQYMGSVGSAGETGVATLEEQLKLARAKVTATEANPAAGSGTPYLAAGGVVGASVVAGAVFGGIAIAFVVKGRSGKYYAQGRG